MASVQIQKKYEGKSDGEVYEAAKQAIINAGFSVWKTRELARLVLGTGTFEGKEVRLNVVVSMIDGSATASAESGDLDEKALTPIPEKIHQELAKLLT
ncbi:MAG: hypothetical protein Q8N39_00570 [Pelolinea sp.]|nr:hypothetical protein [Pelolinea sp.]